MWEREWENWRREGKRKRNIDFVVTLIFSFIG